MNNCILCLNKTLKKNSVSISEEEESGLTIEEIIKQHFWFFEKILIFSKSQKQAVTCRCCFEKLEAFHEFFSAVKFNHKQDDEDQIETETQSESIKSEMETEEVLEDISDEVHEEYLEDTDIGSDLNQLQHESPERTLRKRKFEINKNPELPPKKKKLSESSDTIDKKNRFDITEEELDILKSHTELKCEKCDETGLNSWMDIRSHYRQTHKVIGYVRCCGKKIDRSNELKDHISWHLNPHIFQCHVCGKSSISRENLRLHEKIHIADEDRKFSCSKCDKKFVHKYTLRVHMNQVHDKDEKEPTIPCKFCDKFYKTERQLKGHVDFCHKESQQTWICHICSKILKTKSTLEIHVKAHTNPDDPIECNLCGHILKNKRRFAIHMSKHKSEANGPYECEKGCGKIFKHRYAMLDHVQFVHTNKQFSCSYCEKSFKHKKALEEHEAVHSGLNLYFCPFCDRSFKNSGNMHSHKKKAHPEDYKSLPAPSYLGNLTLGEVEDE